VRFGLQIAFEELSRLRDVAQAAEALGFRALYFPDHLVVEGPERQREERPARDPFVEAAVAAVATREIEIGHLVLCNLFRHPAVTARSVSTLDELSGGRTIAGLGTGWTESEFRMTGIPFPDIGTRLRMLDEALACLHGLWADGPFSFAGEFYQLADATLLPRPVRRPHPPILLGGSGRGLLRLAARHADRLNVIAGTGREGYIALRSIQRMTEAAFREKVRFVRDETARLGRDPRAVAISQTCFTTVLTESPAATRAMADGLAGMMGGTPEAALRAPMALVGTPEECVAELRRRAREWEVEEAIFVYAGDAMLRRLGDEVLPFV
jgi:probable F420-dependent oxidoreductase